MRVLGIIISFVALIVGFTIVRGAILVEFWDWFILPKFSGAPTINLAEALGIAALIGLLTHEWSTSDDKGGKTAGEIMLETTIRGVIIYSVIYVSGAIIAAFV